MVEASGVLGSVAIIPHMYFVNLTPGSEERKVLEVRFLRRFRRLFGILQKRLDSSGS